MCRSYCDYCFGYIILNILKIAIVHRLIRASGHNGIYFLISSNWFQRPFIGRVRDMKLMDSSKLMSAMILFQQNVIIRFAIRNLFSVLYFLFSLFQDHLFFFSHQFALSFFRTSSRSDENSTSSLVLQHLFAKVSTLLMSRVTPMPPLKVWAFSGDIGVTRLVVCWAGTSCK